MADEKQKTADIDDWLEDLDEGDEFSGELDQANIDALLSGSSSTPESGGAGPDAPAADDGPGELDQANIDALFSEMTSGLAGKGQDDEGASGALELDQANIDALLGGTFEKGDREEKGEEIGELNQSDIDLLLDDGEEDKPRETAAAVQGDIDSLLGGEPPPAVNMGEGLEVDQDEIDQLFAGLDDEDDEEGDDSFAPENMDLADVLGSDGDFLELDGDTRTAAPGGPSPGADREATVATLHSAASEEESGGKGMKKGGLFSFLPESINKAVAGGVAACLLLAVGVGWYFFRQPEPPAIIEPQLATEKPVEEAPAPNFVPVASPGQYEMPANGGEVAVVLAARDDDSDPLTFQVASQPQHGRLSGEAPQLIYLPNKDFPGEDRFEFVVSDGKDASSPALVVISGPNLAQQLALEEKKKEEEKEKRAAQVVKTARKKATEKKAQTARRVPSRPADLPPQIRITGLADSYLVGETVLLDASSTRDESRRSVRFSWEQLSGTRVLIKPVNEEGSIISFATPSYFSTISDPGPVLRLTATDESGKADVKLVKIRSVSRRQTALWQGDRGGNGNSPLHGDMVR